MKSFGTRMAINVLFLVLTAVWFVAAVRSDSPLPAAVWGLSLAIWIAGTAHDVHRAREQHAPSADLAERHRGAPAYQ